MAIERLMPVETLVMVTGLAELVKSTLYTRGQNMRAAAKEMGVSTATVCRLGQGKDCRIALLPRLARWADVTPAEMFDLIENES